jgi:hypothetical protein
VRKCLGLHFELQAIGQLEPPRLTVYKDMVCKIDFKAEVVELADTPSARIALAILYKLLIIKLLPFTSITSIDSPQSGQ